MSLCPFPPGTEDPFALTLSVKAVNTCYKKKHVLFVFLTFAKVCGKETHSLKTSASCFLRPRSRLCTVNFTQELKNRSWRWWTNQTSALCSSSCIRGRLLINSVTRFLKHFKEWENRWLPCRYGLTQASFYHCGVWLEIPAYVSVQRMSPSSGEMSF